jgi:hypothetical protein
MSRDRDTTCRQSEANSGMEIISGAERHESKQTNLAVQRFEFTK